MPSKTEDIKNLVAVIILNHNKKNDLLECLKSVCCQGYINYKIIVVDNASDDGSADSVKSEYPDVHLIRSVNNLGAVEGRNIGWRYAENNFNYHYLLFLDNDVVIDKYYLKNLVEVFEDNQQIGIACGKAYTDLSLKKIMSTGIYVNLFNGSIHDVGSGKDDDGRYSRSGYTGACGAFAMMIRRNLFNLIGGFDKNYSPYGWEDVDFCLKAKKHGFFSYYCFDAVLIHKGTKLGRKPNPIYEKSKIKNYIFLLRNNTNLFQKITCLACLPFRASMLALKLIFNGNAEIILEHFKGFVIGINNIKLSSKLNKQNL